MKKRFMIWGLLLSLTFSLQAQDTLRLMHYNLLFYGSCGGVTIEDKDTWLGNITGFYQPDILTVNEMGDNIAYANRIKSRALTYGNMEYTEFTNTTNSDIVNMLFYNEDKFEYLGIEKIGNSLRDINVYSLYYKQTPMGQDSMKLYVIVCHLKASRGGSNETRRRDAIQDILTWRTNHPDFQGNFIIMGDLNIYQSNEPAYTLMTNYSDPDMRFYDPAGLGNGWGSSTVQYLTQSTSEDSRTDCGVPGGLDDRFDFVMPSGSIMNGTRGFSYLPGSYLAFGNDGNTPYNGSLNCVNNSMVTSTVCGSLSSMSDHLPVVMQMVADNTTGIFNPIQLQDVGLKVNNPFGEQLKVQVSAGARAPQSLRWQLLNLQGQVLWQGQKQLLPGRTEFTIPTAHLPSGLYLLKGQDASGRTGE
jgi:hypothetical protein